MSSREDLFTDRREIKSQTSNNIYIVAKRISTGLYECSCPGWKSRRKCKHLRTMNLPTVSPLEGPPAPRSRSSRTTPSDFADNYKKYDPAVGGFGSPDEWRNAAKDLAKGRGQFQPPVKAATPTPSAWTEADMALIGITVMPPDADGLLAAMQARAEILNDPVTGSPDEFWAMFSAYERLINLYPAT